MTENIKENFDRIPTKERNDFQFFLMEKRGVERGDHEAQGKWLKKYGKSVSDIIDNTENKDIRDFIMTGNYDEASKFVIEILEKEKVSVAA